MSGQSHDCRAFNHRHTAAIIVRNSTGRYSNCSPHLWKCGKCTIIHSVVSPCIAPSLALILLCRANTAKSQLLIHLILLARLHLHLHLLCPKNTVEFGGVQGTPGCLCEHLSVGEYLRLFTASDVCADARTQHDAQHRMRQWGAAGRKWNREAEAGC